MEEYSKSLNDPLLKLAFFEPNLADENDNQVVDYLILDGISGYGTLLECTPQEIARYIKTTFLIDFDEAEIIKGAERLQKKGNIRILGSENPYEQVRIKFIKNEDDHKKSFKESKDLQELVFSEWTDYLKDKYKNILNPDKINTVVESFKSFLSKICVRHGKESVSILYPESEKTQEWIKSIQGEIIKDLPSLTKELDILLQIEIPIFFRNNSVHRKKYIANLFNASFIWHLIQIDETCTEYFKSNSKNQILVLDANILFSAIGFNGSQVLTSIHNLLGYANQLGYNLLVTTKTLDEFYDSIQRNCEKAYNSQALSKGIANVAISTLETSSFLSTYWKEFIEKGLTIAEFAIEKSHIETILKGLKVTITDEFREEIESSEDLLEEESILRSFCGISIGSNIIEHDAFHNIFIQKLRRTLRYKYSHAEAWFLTHDSKLPGYAQITLRGKKSLPFCLTTNEWIQINRPFIKRNESESEFEQSFNVLVTQPYIRSVLANFKVDKIKERILLKLDRYTNMNPELAFEMATDIQFITALSLEITEKSFDEKIDSAIVDKNRNLQFERKELYYQIDLQKEEYNTKIEELEENISEIKKDLTDKNESFGALLSTVRELREKVDISKNAVEEHKSESSFYINKYYNSQNTIRWMIFAFILIILLFSIWILSYNIQAAWYTNLQNKTFLRILLSILSCLLLINIPLYKNWKLWLGFFMTFLAIFIGAFKK